MGRRATIGQSKLATGGRLTMLNVALWVCLIVFEKVTHEWQDPILFGTFVLGAIILSLPFAWFPLFLMAPLREPSNSDIVVFILVIVPNSFAWGYGLERLFFSPHRSPNPEQIDDRERTT